MKQLLYFLLVAGEIFLGLFFLLLMLSWELWAAELIALAVFAVLMFILVKFSRKFKAEGNAKGIKATKILLPIVLLIPLIPATLMIFAIGAALAIHG